MSARHAIVAAIVLSTLAAPATAVEAPRLRALLKQAQLAVSAEVVGVTEYDHGRLSVADLKVSQVIKGQNANAIVRVVEWRDQPVPPKFEARKFVLTFLTLTPRTTYLAKHLPVGQYYALVHQQPACLVFSTATDATTAARLLQRLVVASGQPDADRARAAAAARTFAFDLLATDQPLLIEDGIASLKSVPDLAATLTPSEQTRLEAILDRTTLPVRVRLALIETIADLRLAQLAPALRRQRSPQLIVASSKALGVLGAAPSREETETRLTSDVPEERIAALRELLRADKSAAIPRVTRIAVTDPDAKVQAAAIEALGECGTDAVPALEQIFNQASWQNRREVARALQTIGGRTPAETYARLAFSAPVEAQRYAVVLLLASVPREDPLVQRVITSHPRAEIRDLAEHGIDTEHH